MQFEAISKIWKAEIARWIERGLVGGWFDSRGLIVQQLDVNPEGDVEGEDSAKVDVSILFGPDLRD